MDLKLFSKKIRTIQESSNELKNENETLRDEIRRVQYEALEWQQRHQGSSGVNGGSDAGAFGKEREIESLKVRF